MAEVRRLKLADGKYEYVETRDDGIALVCLRHGQPWREFIGDKAVWCLFNEALEAAERERERAAKVAEAVAEKWAGIHSVAPAAAREVAAAIRKGE